MENNQTNEISESKMVLDDTTIQKFTNILKKRNQIQISTDQMMINVKLQTIYKICKYIDINPEEVIIFNTNTSTFSICNDNDSFSKAIQNKKLFEDYLSEDLFSKAESRLTVSDKNKSSSKSLSNEDTSHTINEAEVLLKVNQEINKELSERNDFFLRHLIVFEFLWVFLYYVLLTMSVVLIIQIVLLSSSFDIMNIFYTKLHCFLICLLSSISIYCLYCIHCNINIKDTFMISSMLCLICDTIITFCYGAYIMDEYYFKILNENGYFSYIFIFLILIEFLIFILNLKLERASFEINFLIPLLEPLIEKEVKKKRVM